MVQLVIGTLLAKFDLKSSYRNVLVHPDDRWLLGMEWKGQLFVDTAPLGAGVTISTRWGMTL